MSVAKTTGIWQSEHLEALQNFIKKFEAAMTEVANSTTPILTIIENKDDNNDTKSIESLVQSIVAHCNAQIDVMMAVVTEAITAEKNAEEAKGSKVDYAEQAKATLNSVEKLEVKTANLQVGGVQPTDEDLSAVASTFAQIREVMVSELGTLKSIAEEAQDSNAKFAGTLVETINTATNIFTNCVELLNDSKKNYAEIADDIVAMTNKLDAKAESTATETAGAASSSARDVAKGMASIADEYI